jgi:superfamily II DNA or RNA helicase
MPSVPPPIQAPLLVPLCPSPFALEDGNGDDDDNGNGDDDKDGYRCVDDDDDVDDAVVENDAKRQKCVHVGQASPPAALPPVRRDNAADVLHIGSAVAGGDASSSSERVLGSFVLPGAMFVADRARTELAMRDKRPLRFAESTQLIGGRATSLMVIADQKGPLLFARDAGAIKKLLALGDRVRASPCIVDVFAWTTPASASVKVVAHKLECRRLPNADEIAAFHWLNEQFTSPPPPHVPQHRPVAIALPPTAASASSPSPSSAPRRVPASVTPSSAPRDERVVERAKNVLTAGRDGQALPEMEQPDTLRLTLRNYQRQALHWLVDRERADQTVRGGCLCDDMGVGKTIELLALMLRERASPTLIVCPLSVLHQWAAEIGRHSAPGELSVYCYHGTNRRRDASFLRSHDIVLTTYQTLAAEGPAETRAGRRRRRSRKRSAAGAEPESIDGDGGAAVNDDAAADDDDDGDKDEPSAKKTPLFDIEWHRVVLDEAHTIKDRNTLAARSVFALDAQRRWCVTGTPISNSLNDLYALLHFLRVPELGSSYAAWTRCVITPIAHDDDCGWRTLSDVLDPLLLRRTKLDRDAATNARLVDLPPRMVRVKTLDLPRDERAFYDRLSSASREQFGSLMRANAVFQNYHNVLELLLRLRQACAHPTLVTRARRARSATNVSVTASSSSSSSSNDMSDDDGEVTAQDDADDVDHERFASQQCTKINALVAELLSIGAKDASVKSIVFSQWTSMLDLVGSALRQSDIDYVRLDGSMNAQQRNVAIAKFRECPSTRVFLISIKAGAEGLNLVTASRVFILEPCFNAAIEEQAIDRVHRVGQRRPVVVTRYIVRNSIEERIARLQQYKRDTASRALHGANGASQRDATQRVRLNELQSLFA